MLRRRLVGRSVFEMLGWGMGGGWRRGSRFGSGLAQSMFKRAFEGNDGDVNDPEAVLRLWSQYQASHHGAPEPLALSAAIRAHRSLGNHRLVLRLYHEWPEVELMNIAEENVFLSAQYVRDVDTMVTVLAEREAAGRAVTDRHREELLIACVESGDEERAETVLAMLERSSGGGSVAVAPHVYAKLARICVARKENAERAARLLLSTAACLPDPQVAVEPLAGAALQYLRWCILDHSPSLTHAALVLLDKLGSQLDEGLLRTLLAFGAGAGAPDVVAHAYHLGTRPVPGTIPRSTGQVWSEELESVSANALLHAHGVRGDLLGAAACVADMHEKGITPDPPTLRQCAVGLCVNFSGRVFEYANHIARVASARLHGVPFPRGVGNDIHGQPARRGSLPDVAQRTCDDIEAVCAAAIPSTTSSTTDHTKSLLLGDLSEWSGHQLASPSPSSSPSSLDSTTSTSSSSTPPSSSSTTLSSPPSTPPSSLDGVLSGMLPPSRSKFGNSADVICASWTDAETQLASLTAWIEHVEDLTPEMIEGWRDVEEELIGCARDGLEHKKVEAVSPAEIWMWLEVGAVMRTSLVLDKLLQLGGGWDSFLTDVMPQLPGVAPWETLIDAIAARQVPDAAQIDDVLRACQVNDLHLGTRAWSALIFAYLRLDALDRALWVCEHAVEHNIVLERQAMEALLLHVSTHAPIDPRTGKADEAGVIQVLRAATALSIPIIPRVLDDVRPRLDAAAKEAQPKEGVERGEAV